MKRIVSLLLVLALLVPCVMPARAMNENDNRLIDDLEESFEIVSKSVLEAAKGADPSRLQQFKQILSGFAGAAKGASTVLSVVNGSVSFLRLIGVMKDPTQSALADISAQLATIGEQVTAIDARLSSLAGQMTKIEARAEFHARAQMAVSLEAVWRNCSYLYMEDGMDRLMDNYNTMLVSGLKARFGGKTVIGDEDTSSVTVLYHKSGDTYTPYYVTGSGIPKRLSPDDRALTISPGIIPQSLSWNVNTWHDDLVSALTDSILAALRQKRYDAFTAVNYPMFTEKGWPAYVDEGVIIEAKRLASDTADALAYHVAAGKVSEDASFADEVKRTFANYCMHLTTSGDGVDALLKTFYLTHAFESQVSDDVTSFCNSMIVKTGTYGVFTANILGMADTVTDNDKKSAMERLASTVLFLSEAKENALTGRPRFSYITNTELIYSDAEITASATATIDFHNGSSMRTFKSASVSDPVFSTGTGLREGSALIGDTNMLILASTLESLGLAADHATLRDCIGIYTPNMGMTVTSLHSAETLALDGTVRMHSHNLCGDYFPEGTRTNSTPDDASADCWQGRRKLLGSVYDTSTGELTADKVLSAVAAYGENHMMWFVDESAILTGPADCEYFSSVCSKRSDGTLRIFTASSTLRVNAVFSEPLPADEEKSLLTAKKGTYSPLASFRDLDLGYAAENGSSSSGSGFSVMPEGPANAASRAGTVWIVSAAAILCVAAAAVPLARKKRAKASAADTENHTEKE